MNIYQNIQDLMPLKTWLEKNEPIKNKLAWRENLARNLGMTRQNIYLLSKKDDWFVSNHGGQVQLVNIRAKFEAHLLTI